MMRGEDQAFAGCLLVTAAMGLVAGFVLWAFRLIPAWGIAVSAVLPPVSILLLIVITAAVYWTQDFMKARK